jgi:hypothetical protein
MYPYVHVGSRSYTRPACRANIGDCMEASTGAPAPTNEVIACLKGGLQATTLWESGSICRLLRRRVLRKLQLWFEYLDM